MSGRPGGVGEVTGGCGCEVAGSSMQEVDEQIGQHVRVLGVWEVSGVENLQ